MPSGHTKVGMLTPPCTCSHHTVRLFSKLDSFAPAMAYDATLDLDTGILEGTSEAVVSIKLRVELESHLLHRGCELLFTAQIGIHGLALASAHSEQVR